LITRRILPCLLLKGNGLYKTVRFRDPTYVGDPINVVRIFNDKEVDEIAVLDIEATKRGSLPLPILRDLATECFMPLCYGGGVSSVDDLERLFGLGIEKVAINTAAVADPSLVTRGADLFGSQSIVVSLDVRSRRGRWTVATRGGTRDTKIDVIEMARRMEGSGAGELLITSIDREGTGTGYDLELIRAVTSSVSIPVIAHGGAAGPDDLRRGFEQGASAVAAGSMFVFRGKHRAVLISYPDPAEKDALVGA
jgi:cyclase